MDVLVRVVCLEDGREDVEDVGVSEQVRCDGGQEGRHDRVPSNMYEYSTTCVIVKLCSLVCERVSQCSQQHLVVARYCVINVQRAC